ncbi:MAG: 50S ribosomal protein L24 [Aphanocapsa lilacina HA4352-LM1]|jgi:large subunit ribosomal protein L24|uniref:Large ribosomal subunit protein uL24 n=1 Tax=Gloeobacter morelensis MG652769 TaxID=2781736 RepID=A0ABY3PIN7_9CYAN|nr:50S ribosomal protein L24 [Gloeobacter morelensis]MBW4696971.1 50S ribosomal protein L24 [Aphanocapsa lilacina HA4352-LM1]UFP93526.1 50S ribosomal protein L24 [Gloeobacter morelensis MG652769]
MATNNGAGKARHKFHVKKGDTVQVISGKDKGKVGKVTEVLPTAGKVIVEGVNLQTKHVKPQGDQQGQTLRREAPIYSCKVMLYSDKKKQASRVGHTVTEAGKKVRVLKKTGEILDK